MSKTNEEYVEEFKHKFSGEDSFISRYDYDIIDWLLTTLKAKDRECDERVREERERMMHEINARVDNLSRCPEKPQRRSAFQDGFSDCLDQVMLILGKKVDCTNCMDRGYVKNILFDFLEKCDHPSHLTPTKTDKTTNV